MSEPNPMITCSLDEVLGVLQRISGISDRDAALAEAVERGWLDDASEPTDEGRDVVAALRDQGQTRTAFRGF
ncbi:MAG: hypothetical protein AAFO63_09710 [Pseudomonadota bacterium]